MSDKIVEGYPSEASATAPSSATEVTAQFDHLATRDPAAMEQAAQAPDHAGAAPTGPFATLGTTPLGAAVAGSDVYGMGSVTAAREETLRPLNPEYTPPSQVAPPHVTNETDAAATDLPAGSVLDPEGRVR